MFYGYCEKVLQFTGSYNHNIISFKMGKSYENTIYNNSNADSSIRSASSASWDSKDI